jgi:hypothetical protein
MDNWIESNEDYLNLKINEEDLEKLLDYLSDSNLNDQIKALESLKIESKDWKSIDNKINELYELKNDKSILTENINQVKKIKTFLETYSNDEMFSDILETYVNRINKGKEAYLRSLTASKMTNDGNYQNYSKEKLSQISERFLNRAKELGF